MPANPTDTPRPPHPASPAVPELDVEALIAKWDQVAIDSEKSATAAREGNNRTLTMIGESLATEATEARHIARALRAFTATPGERGAREPAIDHAAQKLAVDTETFVRAAVGRCWSWRERDQQFLDEGKVRALLTELLNQWAGRLAASSQGRERETVSVSVAGEVLTRTLVDFERACLLKIEEEQERANPDTSLIDVLCDAVRLKREHLRSITGEIPLAPPAQGREREPWVILYEDADIKPEVFTGEGAEQAARIAFADRSVRWACHLLCAAAAGESRERVIRAAETLVEGMHSTEGRPSDYAAAEDELSEAVNAYLGQAAPAREPGASETPLTTTARGFAIAEFEDANGVKCSLQKSSSALEDKVWLGCNEPNAQVMPGDGTGWHDYPLPENVQCTTRMHLTREQVAALLPALQRFVATGELAPVARPTEPGEESAQPSEEGVSEAMVDAAMRAWFEWMSESEREERAETAGDDARRREVVREILTAALAAAPRRES